MHRSLRSLLVVALLALAGCASSNDPPGGPTECVLDSSTFDDGCLLAP